MSIDAFNYGRYLNSSNPALKGLAEAVQEFDVLAGNKTPGVLDGDDVDAVELFIPAEYTRAKCFPYFSDINFYVGLYEEHGGRFLCSVNSYTEKIKEFNAALNSIPKQQKDDVKELMEYAREQRCYPVESGHPAAFVRFKDKTIGVDFERGWNGKRFGFHQIFSDIFLEEAKRQIDIKCGHYELPPLDRDSVNRVMGQKARMLNETVVSEMRMRMGPDDFSPEGSIRIEFDVDGDGGVVPDSHKFTFKGNFGTTPIPRLEQQFARMLQGQIFSPYYAPTHVNYLLIISTSY